MRSCQIRTQPAVNILREVSEAIETATDHKVHSWVELGFPNITYGQEHRIILSSKARGYEETLLRAYIPLAGSPIRVLVGDGTSAECSDTTELKAYLHSFLKQETVRTLIQQLRDLSR